MSVLEKFFQITMVIALISLGIELTIDVFGYEMTGQNISTPDLESAWVVVNSQIQQSGATPSVSASVISGSIDWIYIQFGLKNFGIQKVIYTMLSPYDSTCDEDIIPEDTCGTDETCLDCTFTLLAIRLGELLLAIEIAGFSYLIMAIGALIFGGEKP